MMKTKTKLKLENNLKTETKKYIKTKITLCSVDAAVVNKTKRAIVVLCAKDKSSSHYASTASSAFVSPDVDGGFGLQCNPTASSTFISADVDDRNLDSSLRQLQLNVSAVSSLLHAAAVKHSNFASCYDVCLSDNQDPVWTLGAGQ